jgi:glycosyltransferase involved in cell wall biosynthesis
MAEAKTPSLSICLLCYNDAGTIGSLVAAAFKIGRELTPDHEVVVVNDGSTDGSQAILAELQSRYPELRLVRHPINQGYGAAVRSALRAATKDWIFYTDGDGQYDVLELSRLWQARGPGVEVVNGYKVHRADPWYRVLIGWGYNLTNKLLFGIRLRDIDCDFRLIRTELVRTLDLRAAGGEICVEMARGWERRGVRVVEVPVSHFHRVLGRSQFFRPARIVGCVVGLVRLWRRLRREGRDRIGFQPSEYDLMFALEDRHWWYRGMAAIHWALGAVPPPRAPGRWLDVGCGTGGRLASIRPAGIGLDVSLEALRRCRQRGLRHLVQGAADALPFRAGAFDWLTCCDVLSVVADPAVVLLESHRVLRDGGSLTVSSAAVAGLFGPHDLAVGSVRRFSRHQLRSLLQTVGFRVIRLSYANALLLAPIWIVRKLQLMIGWFGRGGPSFDLRRHSRLVELVGHGCLRLEAWLLRYADLPIGVSLVGLARRDAGSPGG